MAQAYENRLIRVVNYIHDNLDGDLSLDALSDVAAMSRFHWHRIWTAMTGETLAQTTRRIRLHRASVMLVFEDATLPEIAARCGYPDQASFTRAFRERMGVTPGVFRDRGRALPPLRFDSHSRENDMTYEVRLSEEAVRKVAGIEHKGAYQEISRAFETLAATLAARGQIAQMREMVGVYYEDARSMPVEDLRSYAGAVVPEQFDVTEPFKKVELSGGEYAVLTFHGPYTGLQKAYDFFFGEWLTGSGRDAANSPCFEKYLNTPADTAPENLVTEIYMPLVSAS